MAHPSIVVTKSSVEVLRSWGVEMLDHVMPPFVVR
jgi:hypothetical protein